VNVARKIALRLLEEWPLAMSLATTLVFLVFGKSLLADLSHPVRFTLILTWLLLIILFSVFAVVRHAESLAEKLGEPLGTLVLTLSVTGIEVMIIVATMSTGQGSPTLARDAMFAVIMIVLNGMVGLTLLIGALRYHEQDHNLQGANAFLAVILPLAVIGLVVPNYTHASADQTFSTIQAAFLTLVSVVLYGIFLTIQTGRHREYFRAPRPTTEAKNAKRRWRIVHEVYSVPYHTVLLLAYMGPLVILAKQLAVPIDFTIRVMSAPVALAGLLVAMLVLAPESISAVRAALVNDLQRSVNILLGSALATIGLTIPVVAAIAILSDWQLVLGVNGTNEVLLALTLLVATLSLSTGRTTIMQGVLHLVLFGIFLFMLVVP